MKELEYWEQKFIDYLTKHSTDDSSHGLGHFQRVWKIANDIASDDADLLVILASAYFHDIVSYPKDHPDRSKSSTHAALKTEQILNEMNFPKEKIDNIKHCVEAHSYSANITPETIEAKIVQDADRMEALGAIGLARTFYISGRIGSELFNEQDPFAKNRELDDKKYALDHFKVKLLKLPEKMQTVRGKAYAAERAEVLIRFTNDLEKELFI